MISEEGLQISSLSQLGRVIAVCLRAVSGVPKYPQGEVFIGVQGVEGDFHAGPVNRHKKSGDPEPNWRQVTVVAQEVLDDLNARLGTHLGPGDLGENVLLQGHGDLSELREGDRIQLGSTAVIEVSRQNRPCATISVYHPDLVQELLGRRGVAAIVITPGWVRPGDASRIFLREMDGVPALCHGSIGQTPEGE